MSNAARVLLVLSCALGTAPAGAPAEVRGAVQKADEYVRAGQRAQALVLLDGIVAKSSCSLDAHILYQDVKRAAGEGSALVRHYRERMRKAPDDPVGRYLYARLLTGRSAVGEARKLTRLAPEFPRGWVLYAQALRRTDRLRPARKAAERALELAPRLAIAHEALGRVLEREGTLDRAEVAYKKAIALDERCLKPRYKLAHLLVRRERGHEALATLREARKHAPGEPLVRVHEGLVLGALGRRRDALRAYKEAVDAAPADPLVLVLLGETYAELGEWELAAKAIDRALDKDPKLAAAHAARGYMALRRNALDDAERAYKEASRLAPKHAAHSYYLGLIQTRRAKHRDAVRYYRRAASANGKLGYRLALGGALEKTGRMREALTVYRDACKIAPENPDPLIRLGHVASELREYRKAVKAFEAAHVLDPKDKEVLLSLGVTYEVGLRDGKKAADYYRKYLDAGGRDERVKRWLDALTPK